MSDQFKVKMHGETSSYPSREMFELMLDSMEEATMEKFGDHENPDFEIINDPSRSDDDSWYVGELPTVDLENCR